MKKKLTNKQIAQIKKNRNAKLQKYKAQAEHELLWKHDMLGVAQRGRVVNRQTIHADVEGIDGKIYRCNLRRTASDIVVGDYVIWRAGLQQLDGISGVIETVEIRKNQLNKPDYYDGIKTVVANIDQIIIVSAILPTLSYNIIDRYIVACETNNIRPIVVINKIDLLNVQEINTLATQLKIYENIGYHTIMLSSYEKSNLAELERNLIDKTSVFVGQSGVGKSSLIKLFIPDVDVQVGAISNMSGLGQHTTSSSYLYHLKQGGEIIDSPGVREFGLWHLDSTLITKGYKEFQNFLGLCKFSDCKHKKNDQYCAIKEAMEKGSISQLRYDNYHKLMDSLVKTKKYVTL